jgi:3-phenylpropionate/trans-cinnamate dioxygenase ferredoxin subunit
MSDWTDVADCAGWESGQRKFVEIDDVPIIVLKVGEDFFAIEDLCSHEAYPMAEGEVQGDRILCPKHGAAFCLRTGAPLSAPAYSPLVTFPVRIHEGRVQVRDPRWD